MSESDFDSGKAFYDAEKKAEEHNPVKTGFLDQFVKAVKWRAAKATSKPMPTPPEIRKPFEVSTPTAIPDPPRVDKRSYGFGSYTTCSRGPVAITGYGVPMGGVEHHGYRDHDEDEERRRHDDFIDAAVIIPLLTGGSGGGE